MFWRKLKDDPDRILSYIASFALIFMTIFLAGLIIWAIIRF